MEKIWIECQRCGSVFWVFADELNSIYPKNRIDYKICSACEGQLKLKNSARLSDFSLRSAKFLCHNYKIFILLSCGFDTFISF